MLKKFLLFLVVISLVTCFTVVPDIGNAGKVYAGTINVSISLRNNTKAYEGTTLGMGGTVMPFGYDSSWQLKDFNDDDFAIMLTQLKKTGSTIVRLWLDGSWWEPVNDNSDPAVMNDAGFTWDSVQMQCLYKYIQGFKDAGVDCIVSLLGHDGTLMYPWLICDPKEQLSGPNTGMIPEYAEHIAAMVKQLCVNKGFANVKYVNFSAEPNNYFTSPSGTTKLQWYKDTLTGVYSRLQSENLLQYVKLIGPEIGYNDSDTGTWISDLSTNVDSSLDAYSFHTGQGKQEGTDGSWINLISGYINTIRTNDPNGANKPIMFTDYSPMGTIRTNEDGLNTVALIANGLRIGVSDFGRWSFAEDIWVWPGAANQTSTSFGDYGYGIIGSKQENFVVRPNYKATSLMYKFIPKGSTTYIATTSNEAVIPAMIKTSDGRYTIILVNWTSSDVNVSFALESSINATFSKYKYSSSDLDTVSKFGEIPSSFGTQTINGTSFTDTIPANTVYYYTNIPDTTAPGQVTGTSASSADMSKAAVTWNARTDSDLGYYRIYRSETSNFTPSLTNKVGEIWVKPGATPAFNDKNIQQFKTYYYKVSAVDTSENEGSASSQASVTIGGETYTNNLGVTDNTTYDYYEINSDFENGYLARISKKTGVIGFLQDKLGYNRLNLNIDSYSFPMIMKYSDGAYSDISYNGNAESGSGTPDNWYNWTDQNGVFTWDSNVVHSGSRSLEVYNPSQSDHSCWYETGGAATPGKSYEVTYWCKTDNITGPVDLGQGVYLNVEFLDSNGNALAAFGGFDSQENTGSHDWKYFLGRYVAPANSVNIRISARVWANSGTAWFDDIRVEEQPTFEFTGQRPLSYYEADSVTYNNISSTHKQIVTVLGPDTLYFDFYTDRIEVKVNGTNTGGYLVEAGGIVPKNVTSAYWSDGSEDIMNDTSPGTLITKNTTYLSIYQPPSPQTIRFEFNSSKPVTLRNASRFRGYYPRFQLNSDEVFAIKFPKKADNPNPGAETGTSTPDNWYTWSQDAATFIWDSSVYHWGSKALKIDKSASGVSSWYTSINTTDISKTWRLGGWVKTTSASGTGAMIFIEARDSGGNMLAGYTCPFITGTTGWTRYEVSLNPPVGTTQIFIGGRLWGAGTVWFDDFELNYDETGIHNAGCEDGSSSPADWYNWTSSGTPFTWDNTTYYQGNRSLKINNTSGQYSGWYTTRTNLQVNKEYEFGGWIKTENVTAGNVGARFEFDALDSNNNPLGVRCTSFMTGTNGWTYVTGKIVIPPNTASVKLAGQLWGADGTAWFDDMFIRLVDKS